MTARGAVRGRHGGGPLAALAVLTVLPVRRPGEPALRAVLPWAPLVGALLATIAAAEVAAGAALVPGPSGALLVAAVAVGTLAWLTRGLHLDGLADTADGLGPIGPADRALAVLRRPDIGPFGVLTLVVVVVLQLAALAQCITAGRGPIAIAAAVLVGRLAMVRAGVPGVPPARRTGLGAAVAGSVPPALLTGLLGTAGLVVVAVALFGDPVLGAGLAAAAVGGLAAAEWLLRRCCRRFGGVTGDVFGAVSEVATTAALIALALTPG